MREELRIPIPGDADYKVGDVTKFAFKQAAALFNKGLMPPEQHKNGNQVGDHSRNLLTSLKTAADGLTQEGAGLNAALKSERPTAAGQAITGEDVAAEVESAQHLRYLCRSMSNYRQMAEDFQEFWELGVDPLVNGDSSVVDATMAFKGMQTLNPAHSADTSFEDGQAAQKVVIRSLSSALKMTQRDTGRLLLFGNPSIKECFQHVGSKQWSQKAMLNKILVTIDAQLSALHHWGGVEHSDVIRILVR